MLKKKLLFLISLEVLFTIKVFAQTNPASARRDWYVGHYEGVLKDSSYNISVTCEWDIYKTENHPWPPYTNVNDDSTVVIPIPSSTIKHVICIDSTTHLNSNRYCSSWPNPTDYGILNADSSFKYVFTPIYACTCNGNGSPPFCNIGALMVYHGKKTSDTPVGLAEDLLKNSQAVIYPNPVELGHVNMLSNIEFDELVFYDLLGKQYNITISKTGSGYHIDLPEGIEAGVYVLVMRKGKQVLTKKVMLKQN